MRRRAYTFLYSFECLSSFIECLFYFRDNFVSRWRQSFRWRLFRWRSFLVTNKIFVILFSLLAPGRPPGAREKDRGQGERLGGAYPALTRHKLTQEIKKRWNLNGKKGVKSGSSNKKRLCNLISVIIASIVNT